MGETMVVTSGKGGVGKTTATANIGSALASLGYRVALVDADIGLRNLDVVLGLENRIVYDLVDVVEGFCRLKQAMIKDKRTEGLYLLPAAQTRDKSAVNPEQMRRICDQLKETNLAMEAGGAEYLDYILVDSPAGIEQGFRNAVAGADRAFIVTTPEVSAVRDADRIIGLLEAENLPRPQLIINRFRPGMVRSGDMMDIEDMIDILAIALLGVVPEDDAIVVGANRGEPVVGNSGSQAGRAFKNIARRITGEEVPFMEMDSNLSVFGWLGQLFGLRQR
ncbi:MAG: septum site-determining protein MinD [Bacillota bacterium]